MQKELNVVKAIKKRHSIQSTDRDMMFAILRHYGIPVEIVVAIRILYDSSTNRLIVGGEQSKRQKTTLVISLIELAKHRPHQPGPNSTSIHQKLCDLDFANDYRITKK
ncbi:hypothetical protein HELRODRAFT_161271 [Helobdella robusta]|uniref:Uncharacterized protein n=1 Tax=Helobdella robusta TaxID=6412 RepID=T1ERA0_HELRO|nr:hypothetical protein HELRODRAFT_161271 [Helobdella robusta]ESO02044.1 hypothetical protein HELRODRAFT_161271 [Helobdella robusta]